MIDTAFKTHKETAFGWVWAIQCLVAALKARPAVDRNRRVVTLR